LGAYGGKASVRRGSVAALKTWVGRSAEPSPARAASISSPALSNRSAGRGAVARSIAASRPAGSRGVVPGSASARA
jgi:hypothetical protein